MEELDHLSVVELDPHRERVASGDLHPVDPPADHGLDLELKVSGSEHVELDERIAKLLPSRRADRGNLDNFGITFPAYFPSHQLGTRKGEQS
ncbi:MAG: hypothetical protein ACP5PM_09870 [Acidimicrobiales bacterium]